MDKVKTIAIISFITVIYSLHGQEIGSNKFLFLLKRGEVNRFDKLGQKQGIWVDSIHRNIYNYAQICRGDDCHLGFIITGKDTLIKNVGRYWNNKKMGQWQYFNRIASGHAWGVIKTENYTIDGSVEIKTQNEETIYNYDSTRILSYWFRSEDTLKIECNDKTICKAMYHDIEIFKFPLENFDFEKYRFEISAISYRRLYYLEKEKLKSKN